MERSLAPVTLVTALFLGGSLLQADEAQVNQVLDKAMRALGGQKKLARIEAYTWKAKGKVTREGNDNEIQSKGTIQGLDHFHLVFQGQFNGNDFKALSILSGDKGWRKLGEIREMEADDVKNEKQRIYLMVVPAMIVPLKSKSFKVSAVTEEKINDRPVQTLKATGPDGKDFTLSFDKESGLPVREVARVIGWRGEEFEQEVDYSEHKLFDGIKVPTKITVKRDGEPLLAQEITEFKVLDKVPADTVAKPK